MIRGLSALQAAATQQPNTAKIKSEQPPARDVQPRPGFDTLHVSRKGHSLAASNGEATAVKRRADFGAVRTFGDNGQATARGARAAAVVKTTDGQTFTAQRASASVKISSPDGQGGMTATRNVSVITATGADGVKTYKAVQSVSVSRPTPTPVQPAEPDSMLDRMKSAFFSSSGDENFDATLDFNSDGAINHADLAVLHEQHQDAPAPAPKPAEPDPLDQMRDAMFSATGDDSFDTTLDYNSDGQINFNDLSILSAKLDNAQNGSPLAAAPAPTDNSLGGFSPVGAQPVADPAELPRDADPVEAVRQAFFTSAGDEGFDANADINGDGHVDFRDLSELQ